MIRVHVILKVLSFAACLASCVSYEFAQNVKLMSFEDNLNPGKSVGPVRGEDCTWGVLGYMLGEPSIDKAIADIRTQRGSSVTDAFVKTGSATEAGLKYVKNVSTSQDGFNAVLVQKHCIIAKGAGFK